jgi:hypothetical protein
MIQISISLSSTLNALRDAIATDGTLGPMKRNEQRLFYLGRELKTGNRTLSALGIGNHNVFVLHLHSLAPKMVDLHCDEMTKKTSAESTTTRVKSNGNNVENGSETPEPAAGASRIRRQQKKEKEKVVELLESDSEDDDAVEVIEAAAPKRRKRG